MADQKLTPAGCLRAMRLVLRTNLQTEMIAKAAAIDTAHGGTGYDFPALISSDNIQIRRRIERPPSQRIPFVQLRWFNRQLVFPNQGLDQGQSGNLVEILWFLDDAEEDTVNNYDRETVLEFQSLDLGCAIMATLKSYSAGLYNQPTYGLSEVSEEAFTLQEMHTDNTTGDVVATQGSLLVRVQQTVEY